MSEPLVDVTGHRRRRVRARRAQVAGRVAAVAGALALIGFVVWLLYGSALLVVQNVVVQGNQLVTTKQVVAEAAVPEGTPLVRVDERGITERVAALPAVEKVRVERAWPTTLKVTITERVVRLAVPRAGGFDWIDASGVVFHHTPGRPPNTVLAEAKPADEAVLAGIVTVAKALPAQVAPRVQAITASSVDSIVVRLDDGSQIVWGSAESSDLKAQVVAALLEVKAGVYDVSSPTHPTTRGR